MRNAVTFRDAIKKMSSTDDVKIGQCISIDKENNSCVVEAGGLEYQDVRLACTIKPELKSNIIFPAVGSTVMITRVGQGNQWKLEMYSEIDSVMLSIEEQTLKIDKDGFVFNEGIYGMVKAEKLVDRLNLIEKEISDIISWQNGHTHDVVSFGLSKTPTTPYAGALNKTTIDIIENPKIKH